MEITPWLLIIPTSTSVLVASNGLTKLIWVAWFTFGMTKAILYATGLKTKAGESYS